MTHVPQFVRRSISVGRYVWSHPANETARVKALARAVTFQVKGRSGSRPTLARVGLGMRIEAPIHATGASKAVYANPPDWSEMLAWRRILRPGDLFVDVGSNVGLYAVWAADCGATPVAVEPDPVNAERTRKNLALNGVPVELHRCALAGRAGVMRFSRDFDTVNHLVVDGQAVPSRSREVEVKTLDEIVGGRHVRGVKIDVEGAERLVLEGATDCLSRQLVDVFQLEWNRLSESLLGETRKPAQTLLEDAGYVLCRPDDTDFQLLPINGIHGDSDIFAVSPRMAHGQE